MPGASRFVRSFVLSLIGRVYGEEARGAVESGAAYRPAAETGDSPALADKPTELCGAGDDDDGDGGGGDDGDDGDGDDCRDCKTAAGVSTRVVPA